MMLVLVCEESNTCVCVYVCTVFAYIVITGSKRVAAICVESVLLSLGGWGGSRVIWPTDKHTDNSRDCLHTWGPAEG